MKTSLLLASAALGLALVAGAASAEPIKPAVAFNAGVVSDYVFRGVSQTHNYDPAVQGGIDVTYGAGYAGVWASNVGFFNGTDAEVDLYGGVRPSAAGFSFDFGGIYYAYPGQPSGSGEGYFEFKGAASHPVGPATLGAAVYYSPNFFGPGSLHATYYEANLAVPVYKDKVSLSGALGRQTIEGPGDYTTWNAGVTWNFMPHLAVDARYWDTDVHSFGKPYHARAVVGVKATF
ncbi:MAG: TorF family putative porin [Caulobacteraceae bacterium]